MIFGDLDISELMHLMGGVNLSPKSGAPDSMKFQRYPEVNILL